MKETVGNTPAVGAAEILRAAGTLGLLGGSAHAAPRILALLCDPGVDSRQVAALIEREPGLSLRVLRVANSAYYGMSRSVTSVNRALLLLGLDAVRGIAAAACMDRTLRAAQQLLPVDVDALVRHSLAVAAAGESLARHGARAAASEAFMAGLLHNLGVAVQLSLRADLSERLKSALQCHPEGSIRAAEAAVGLPSHEHCIGVVLEQWQFPFALVEAARQHHLPLAAAAAHRQLAAIVHLGLTLAGQAGWSCELEPAPRAPEPALLRAAGLDPAVLEAVAAELPARVDGLSQVLA